MTTPIAQGPVDVTVRNAVELRCWAQKLYEQVQKKTLDLYWGRNGWCPSSLPRCVRRADFDELMNSGLVTVRMAQMIPNAEVKGGRE